MCSSAADRPNERAPGTSRCGGSLLAARETPGDAGVGVDAPRILVQFWLIALRSNYLRPATSVEDDRGRIIDFPIKVQFVVRGPSWQYLTHLH